MKRIHCLQHVTPEPAAHIAAWAQARGHVLSTTRLFADEALPGLEAVDALVVMGGPMSVHDESKFPWMADEKRLIAAAMESGLPVLGVCLGAQLVADVAGARVYRNRFKEIGWFRVEATREGAWHPRFRLPRAFDAFHWHGDTFHLPSGAVQLARTEACEQQMFAIGERVLGIQFHLEVTSEVIADMVAHSGNDLTEGPFVQRREQLAGSAAAFEASHGLLESLLDPWIGGEVP